MTRIFAPRETRSDETRAALTPEAVGKLTELGLGVCVQRGIGARADFPDAAYEKAGAALADDPATATADADIVVRVRQPSEDEADALAPGTLHISFLDPFRGKALLTRLAGRKIDVISLEMIPRSTLAQKMDALSSQANLAGYAAVITAARGMRRILPMMMTPAGTIPPARFFVIGVGVAGLQAIATAKRLGARVEAFDTRPEVEDQVRSLGAKFVKVDLGDTGQTDQGYANQLTEEQLAKQRAERAKACARADAVITTAKVFGREAPRIVTGEVLAGMRPGSLVVDLAVESGGNVEGSKVGEETRTENGVRVIGPENAEGQFATDASGMFASNICNLIAHFWDAEAKRFAYPDDDRILGNCLLARGGAVVHEKFRD